MLLYSMGGLARPRVNLWHRLGSQPPPALRVARDTACHSARSIPPPVDMMCVRIYTRCEYPSVLISLKSCHPLSESLILHFKHKRSRDTRAHPTTQGLTFLFCEKVNFPRLFDPLKQKIFTQGRMCQSQSLSTSEYILSQGTQTIPK